MGNMLRVWISISNEQRRELLPLAFAASNTVGEIMAFISEVLIIFSFTIISLPAEMAF